jgi:DNA-binding GntR family transcriptional regulator
MNTQQAIDDYEALSALAELMRKAAEHGEWDKFINLEQQFNHHAACIRSVDMQADETSRQHLMELLRKTLSDSAEILKQTDVRMSQLKGIMQSNRQEQSLNRLYHGAK